jgi:DNA-binding transcriptional MerR regulator
MSDTYFQQWYSDNKENYNALRKRRYKEDPAYRAMVQERNRQSRERQRDKRKAERLEEKKAIKTRPTRLIRTIEAGVDAHGNTITEDLLTIGAVAKALGKSVQALRLWERKGIIRRTPIISERGDRLYTIEMVEEIRKNLQEQGKLGPSTKTNGLLSYVIKNVALSSGTTARVKLFKIGTLAKCVNRSVVAIEHMEKRGLLPETPLRSGTKSKYRLYSYPMIETTFEALESRGGDVRGEDVSALFSEIAEAWDSLGYLRASIVE